MLMCAFSFAFLVTTMLLTRDATPKDFDHSAICDAIANEQKILLVYRNDEVDQPAREIVPRFLGKTSKGHVLMNALQIAGFNETGTIPGHRSFRLDRASSMTFTKERVPVGPGSGRVPSGMTEVICRR